MAELTPELRRKFDAYIKRYARNGIRLHRPYPPHLVRTGRSKFGGRPNLPQTHDWPIGRVLDVPMPMHFMMQVDFAELPRFGHKLPPTGMLFLFGCDIDMDWCAEDQSDDARLIYIPEVAQDTLPRKPPADSQPIGGNHPHGDWYLPGEKGDATYPEWPIQPQIFQTFPDYWQWENGPEYREYLKGIRDAERARLGATTGWQTQSAAFGPLFDMQSWFQGEVEFPTLGFTLNHVARYFLIEARRRGTREDDRESATATEDFASALLKRSLEIGEANGVPAAECALLSRWVKDSDSRWLSAQRWIDKSLINTVEHFASRPDILNRLPSQLLTWAGKRISHVSHLQYNQMLGWARLSQDVQDLDEPDVCLLQLQHNAFESGEITVWISPKDLERREFGRAKIGALFS